MTQTNPTTGRSREIRPPHRKSPHPAAGKGDHHQGGYPDGGKGGKSDHHRGGGTGLQEEERLGYDDFCKDWYWGHMDSETEPPERPPGWLNTAPLPLKFMRHADYYRD